MDLFDEFSWHSAIGEDSLTSEGNRVVSTMPKTAKTMSMFANAGGGLLVHKCTKALWRISEGEDSIEPVFANDVLTEDDLINGMKS